MKNNNIQRIISLLIVLNVIIFFNHWGWNQAFPIGSEPKLSAHQSLDMRLHHILPTSAASLLPQYTPHDPIVIKTNLDFVTLGFSGDGSPENPYIIEGLNITSTTNCLIKIGGILPNIDVYFQIRNNFLSGIRTTPPEYPGGSVGIHLSHVSHGMIDSNIITNCNVGILLDYESNSNTFTHNIISHNNWGLSLHAGGNTITHNTFSNNTISGISLGHGSNTITHNIISLSRRGIFDFSWGSNTYVNNTVSNNDWGIYFKEVRYNTLLGNNLVNNGLYVWGRSVPDGIHNVIDNMVNNRPLIYWRDVVGGSVPSDAGQVLLVNATEVEVTEQNISRASIGLFAIFCSNLYIHHNIVSNNSQAGIRLEYSGDSTLAYNIVFDNTNGIVLEYASENNTLTHNTVINNSRVGIYIGHTGSNTLSCNTIINNTKGIELYASEQNSLLGNNLINNGLVITSSLDIKAFLQAKVADNIVNDKPLVFWQNVIGGTIPPGAGQILLINSTAIEVTGHDLSQVSIGLFAAFSSNLYIHHNTASNNCVAGIFLESSGNNTLSYNLISRNFDGILQQVNTMEGAQLRYGANNTLSYNTVINNSAIGIYIIFSDNNTVSHNNVANNGGGIVLRGNSNNSTITYNTFSNNTYWGVSLWSEKNTVKWNDFLGNNPDGSSQARDNGLNNIITSNYWNDHDNTDLNGDGIADAPYAIDGDANNQDPAPLTAIINPPPTTTSEVPRFGVIPLLMVLPFLLLMRRRYSQK